MDCELPTENPEVHAERDFAASCRLKMERSDIPAELRNAVSVGTAHSARFSRYLSRMDLAQVRQDFDTIATVVDDQGSGSDRYDVFLVGLVPEGAKTVIDVGSGLGRLSVKLRNADRAILGIDLSPQMVARASAYAQDMDGLEFVCGDFLTDARIDRTFDCVITAATLHHVPMHEGIQRLKAMTAEGGRLIIHDLRNTIGFIDQMKAYMAFAKEAAGRFIRTGNPRSPARVRKAWDDHGRGEVYLTLPEVRSMVDTYLPGARIYCHPAWRYTVVWDRKEQKVR